MKTTLSSFLVGFIFAMGLGVSGMTQPEKVIGFLDVFGDWDFRLALVMAGAIGVHFIFYRWIVKKPAPLFAASFAFPTNRKVDFRLVFGSAIFGIGWGLAGLCPGPAITSLASGKMAVGLFVLSMLIGMQSHRFFEAKIILKGVGKHRYRPS